MKTLIVIAALLLCHCGGEIQDSESISEIGDTLTANLWPGLPPHGTGNATYTVFFPPVGKGGKGGGNSGKLGEGRPAAIFTPGGGFAQVVDSTDKILAARGAAQGVVTFVLDYRLPQKNLPFPGQVCVDDVTRMVRLVRANATKWGINPKNIILHGESAGGELATGIATHWDDGDATNPDLVERESSRPDKQLLFYPITQMQGGYAFGDGLFLGASVRTLGAEWTNDLHVSASTPPAMIFWAADDTVVNPHNSILYVAAMMRNGVLVKPFIFPTGNHGFGGLNSPDFAVVQMKMWPWVKE